MGEEYYCYKDYKQALTLLRHVLWDYRIEKWRPIVSSILSTALRCAYLSANIQEYISLGIEMISNWIICSTDEKSIVQNNINNILLGKPLYPMPGISEQDNKEAEKMWQEVTSSQKKSLIFTIQMASVVPFIECKAGFISENYMADQRVTVTVYLRMNCPQPMSFSKLTVLFNNEYYNQFCEVPSTNGRVTHGDDTMHKLYLVPRNTHTYTFSFIPDLNDIGKVIQITSVALQMGSVDYLCAVLHWTTPTDIHSSVMSYGNTLKAGYFGDDPTFQNIIPLSHARILPRNAQISIDIEHEPPVLINEFYAFHLTITNDEVNTIDNVKLSVALKEGQEQFVHDSTHLTENPEASEQFVQYLSAIPLEKLAQGGKIEKFIYLKATEIAERKLVFEVTYDIEIEMDDQLLTCSCKKSQDLDIYSVEPFEFAVKLLNMKFEEQQAIRHEEPFVLKIDVHSYSPIPIYLEESKLELPSYLKFVDNDVTSLVKNLTLKYNEAGTECFILVSSIDCPLKVNLGTYSLKWKRKCADDPNYSVDTNIFLPVIDAIQSPVYLELESPAHGWVRTPMTITYTIHNRSTSVQDMELVVDSSDAAFMYAGNKQMHFRVLPRDIYKLQYNLYPLIPGYALLPQLRLTLSPGRSNEVSLDPLIREMIPSHIFVMPQVKKSAAKS